MKTFRKGFYTIQDMIASLQKDKYQDYKITEEGLLLMDTAFEGYKMLFMEHIIEGQYSVSVLSNFAHNTLIKNASKVFLEIDLENDNSNSSTMMYLNRHKNEEEISLESPFFLKAFLEEFTNDKSIPNHIRLEIKQDYKELEADDRLHIFTFFELVQQRLKETGKHATTYYEQVLFNYLKEY